MRVAGHLVLVKPAPEEDRGSQVFMCSWDGRSNFWMAIIHNICEQEGSEMLDLGIHVRLPLAEMVGWQTFTTVATRRGFIVLPLKKSVDF